MDKEYARYVLGGSDESAAQWLQVPVEVWRGWPAPLHPVIRDRIFAAALRRGAAKVLNLQSATEFEANDYGELLLESMLGRVSIAAVMAALMDPVPAEYMKPVPDVDRPERRPYTRRDNKPTSTASAAG